jgi:uncharacterized Tic20 family protein
MWDMEGETKVTISAKKQQQQSVVDKDNKAFASRSLLHIMAHFVAVVLVLFIIWHAVPGSSKINLISFNKTSVDLVEMMYY